MHGVSTVNVLDTPPFKLAVRDQIRQHDCQIRGLSQG